jgi:ribokinase
MITVFGSLNVDLVTRVARIPRPGETVAGSDYRVIPGGKGANQALAAARAGARVRMAGAVGADGFAEVALRELVAGGVDVTAVARLPGPTGVALIAVDAGGENAIVLAPGANARAVAASLKPGAIGRGDTLLLQLEVPLAESLAAARLARAAGARTVLSLAPYAPVTPEDLAAIDMLILNEHEAADLAQNLMVAAKGADAVASALARRLSRTVVVTLGAEGAVAGHEAGVTRVPSLPVAVVDTTGAGDAFAAAFIACELAGNPTDACLKAGIAAGAEAVTRIGGQPVAQGPASL